jgi:hypothetical protein
MVISILGVRAELVPMQRNRLKGLNADLLLRFAYYTAVFNCKDLCFIRMKDGSSLSPFKYGNIARQIETVIDMPVVVLAESLSYRERERFIGQGVYFVVSDKYAFLPSLVANVRVKEKKRQPSALTPAAQYLLLYCLLENSRKVFTIRQMETLLPYNYLAIARAVVNLENLQLCKTVKDDSGMKTVSLEHDKRESWDKAQTYLSSPVKKVVYMDSRAEGNFRIGGINALSHYSRLNPEQYDTLAIWDRDFTELSLRYNEVEGNYKIEIWKYPVSMPCLLNEKIVDKLSLYLSLKNEPDARVEKELEKLIENIKWHF